MGGRDHAIECDVHPGSWYSGFNGPDECPLCEATPLQERLVEAEKRADAAEAERDEYATELTEIEAILGDTHPDLQGAHTRDWLRRALRAREARAETAEARLASLVEAVERLLELKDGPRDDNYRELKPLCWENLRLALAGSQLRDEGTG